MARETRTHFPPFFCMVAVRPIETSQWLSLPSARVRKVGCLGCFLFFFAIVLQLNRCCPTIRKRISESVVSNICRKSTFFFFWRRRESSYLRERNFNVLGFLRIRGPFLPRLHMQKEMKKKENELKREIKRCRYNGKKGVATYVYAFIVLIYCTFRPRL